MTNNICNLVGGGLKCDNPKCDYCDMSIEMKDYEKYINKPCPKCGENLLTQEDYNKTKMIMDFVNKINHSTNHFVNKKTDKQITLTIDVHKNKIEINE